MSFRHHGPFEQSPEVEAALFTPTPRSATRVSCVVCGTAGYPGCAWQNVHRRGHAPCLVCGKQLTLKLDGTPREHTRCPGRAS